MSYWYTIFSDRATAIEAQLKTSEEESEQVGVDINELKNPLLIRFLKCIVYIYLHHTQLDKKTSCYL